MADVVAPEEFIPFRFRVLLFSAEDPSFEKISVANPGTLVCQGAFSEVTGLEATMTPKKVQEGGANYGERLLAGPTTFQPITLKRGMTRLDDAWAWFELVTRRANYGLRLAGRIEVRDSNISKEPLLTWVLSNVLPIKFKGADLSATASQVAVEELQIAYEGLRLVRRSESHAGNDRS